MSSAPPVPLPGCLICLLPASASMRQPCAVGGRSVSRLRAARLVIDMIVERLVRLHTRRQPGFEALEAAVIGYGSSGEGPCGFTPLLPGAERDPFVSLEDLAAREAIFRPGGKTRRWVQRERIPDTSEAPVAEGLAQGYQAAQRWLQRRPEALPPVVLLFTDGPIEGESAARVARSLRLLTASTGAAALIPCRLDHGGEPAPQGEEWAARPEDLRQLFARITRLWFPGASAETPACPAPRGEGEPARCGTHRLWLVKRGNQDAEYEDASEVDAGAGLVAVSDGASEGIFTRHWAQLLVRRLIEERPRVADPAALAAWLDGCRRGWAQHIRYPELRWTQQNKVDRSGAAATLLSFELGLQGAHDGQVAWQAWAVGDSCLFWVRGGELLTTFPVASSRHFDRYPALLRTKTDTPGPGPVFTGGLCRVGDLFVLATDAVAELLLKRCEQNAPPSWDELAALPEDDWRSWIETLRDEQQIVNDDCTLVAVRVQAANDPGCPGSSTGTVPRPVA